MKPLKLSPKSLFVSQEYLNRKNSGNGYSIHQPQGNKKYGTEKSGFLLKKSDGFVNAIVSKCQIISSCNTSIVLEMTVYGLNNTRCVLHTY